MAVSVTTLTLTYIDKVMTLNKKVLVVARRLLKNLLRKEINHINIRN